jgi:hypothetical protein
VNAAALKKMRDLGLTLDQAIEIAEAWEEGSARPVPMLDATAERKRARDRVWVYVIAVDHPGGRLVKVGISQHPNFRLATLERERGHNLFLAHTEGPFSRAEAVAIERRAHKALWPEREIGEWFLCGSERATEAVKHARGAPPCS